jgi:hypothetical protein
MAQEKPICFAHCPEGITPTVLRSRAVLWKNEGRASQPINALRKTLTLGSLRSAGVPMFRVLKAHFSGFPPDELTLIWLAAIKNDPRHDKLHLDEIADKIIGGHIAPHDYLPSPQNIAA